MAVLLLLSFCLAACCPTSILPRRAATTPQGSGLATPSVAVARPTANPTSPVQGQPAATAPKATLVAESQSSIPSTPAHALGYWGSANALLVIQFASPDAALAAQNRLGQEASPWWLTSVWPAAENRLCLVTRLIESSVVRDIIAGLGGTLDRCETLGQPLVNHPGRGSLSRTGGMMMIVAADMPPGAVASQDMVLAASRIMAYRLRDLAEVETVVSPLGQDKVLVLLSGVEDPDRVIAVATGTGLVEFVDTGRTRLETGREVSTTFSEPDAKTRVYTTIITGRHVSWTDSETVQASGTGQLSIRLTPEGEQLFADYVQQNMGRHLAVLVDRRVVATAVIGPDTLRDTLVFPMDMTAADTAALAIVLRYGALPFPTRIIEQASCGLVRSSTAP